MKYNAVTVTQLNKYLKDRFDEDENLGAILVKGEISNFKNHYTGHLYFTLKDENSLIKCIMFKSYAERLAFKPKDGMKVMVFGSVSVFERDGVYQIYVKSMMEDGMGDLHEQFEQLKAKLEAEGLFDESHKKPIPLYPKVVGVLTSQTGAVIRDIINVSTRRNPNVYIRLLPVPVQGPGAAEKIAEKIKVMNEKKLADVLIIGRGGGSLEDLWPFNEEIVARAIYDSELPIISAVGHETDFTIADFVADLRAPTPSAAAELAVPDVYELKQKINNYQNRYRLALKKKIELMRLRYEKCMKSRVFTDPLRKIRDMDVTLDSYVQRLENKMKIIHKDSQSAYIKLVSKLDTLSPLKTLTRGYSLTEKDNKIVKSAKELKKDDKVKLKFSDGEKDAIIC
ncbi:exodeoxyribonuclease 7 large subunit [Clostridium sp. CAG:356]|nr:MAG: exodeoxyribonuclease VII large subunit [Clostridium sp. 28_12]CDD37264.1 exodeoxyribonuclease 7 large subunit [Clostridium sp. CAG:356]